MLTREVPFMVHCIKKCFVFLLPKLLSVLTVSSFSQIGTCRPETLHPSVPLRLDRWDPDGGC